MKQRKRFWSTVLVLCLMLSLCPAVLAAGEGEEATVFAEALRWAKAAGVMTATEAAAFDPHGPMTRATAVTLLWRAGGSPAPVSETAPFTDLKEDWYRDAVTWAAENHIYVSDGISLTPREPASRAIVAMMMHGFAE